MFMGYKREFESVDECISVLKKMYARYEEVGYCEVSVLGEDLCVNADDWIWKNLGSVHLKDFGKTIRIMHCPTSKHDAETIDKLDISAELFQILMEDRVTNIGELMDAYRHHSLRRYRNIGSIREEEIKSALDKWNREHIRKEN